MMCDKENCDLVDTHDHLTGTIEISDTKVSIIDVDIFPLIITTEEGARKTGGDLFVMIRNELKKRNIN